MPYRISITVDIPDASDKATTETARKAYDVLSDMEEAAARHDGDLQYDDVEWYGFTADADELTQNSWTYGDEETVRHMIVACETSLRNEDGEFDAQIWLDENTSTDDEDAAEYSRILREFEKRTAKTDLAAHIRYLDRLQDSLPQHDPQLGAAIRYLRNQLR